MLSFCRFGAAFGLAIQSIIRQAVQSSEEQRLRSVHGQPLGWPDEQEGMFRGLQAAFWATAAYLFFGESGQLVDTRFVRLGAHSSSRSPN